MKSVILSALLIAHTPAALAAPLPCAPIRAHFAKDPGLAQSHFGMAFCAAREGNADAAFAYLESATARGFRDDVLLLRYSDFVQLRNDPRWPRAVAMMVLAKRHYDSRLNRELLALFQEDQADRRPGEIDWAVVEPRDKARRNRVRELIDAKALALSDDYYHAAMIYQHGDGAEDIKLAMEYAREAVKLDPHNRRAAWLACAAEDRWLQRSHKPQVWGTQYRISKEAGRGKWTQEPFDRTAKTDAERAAMGVKTLAESAARLEEMNRK